RVSWDSSHSVLVPLWSYLTFCFSVPAPTQLYTLSLHDALPISLSPAATKITTTIPTIHHPVCFFFLIITTPLLLFLLFVITSRKDRKSTRLNSSHVSISYAVFCLKKKTGDTGSMR